MSSHSDEHPTADHPSRGTPGDASTPGDPKARPQSNPHALPTLQGGSAASGTAIGPYRLIEQLGEGGFGIVHLAEQTAPVRRLVALKVLKPGMDSAAVLGRFEAERQALALMDHAGICKVLDAGTTPGGLPYFAMELVRGSPITDYCDLHRLDTTQRLRLFMSVCLAVHHAHQKGVIHRDLKPSNILVTVQDGQPVVKVIDFGIAKATRGSLASSSVQTMMGQFIGTPEYMSPEQAESAGVDIDTRTDVYSLGVLLYELLTGSLPIDSAQLRRASSHEIPRILRELEPEKPSTRVQHVGEGSAPATGGAEPASRLRGTDRASLLRQIKGDLDWITMKAMDKDRTRRYDSAGALAADIDRHLRDEPVLAGPPSAGYRVSKFVRRHRGGVTASVILALSIVVGLIVAVVLYRRADEQRRIADRQTQIASAERAEAQAQRQKAEEQRALAEEQRKLAEVEAQKSRAALDFLTGMFESVDPEESRGRDVTVKQILDRASTDVNAGKQPPEVRAEVFEILGGAYHTLGRYDEAVSHMRLAGESLKSAGMLDTARFYQVQAKLAAALMSSGRLDEAEVAMNTAIEGRTRLLGAEHPDTLFSRSLSATLAHMQNKSGKAMEIIKEVIAVQTRVVGAEETATLDSRTQLADLLHMGGEFEAALAEAKDIASIASRKLGPDSTYTLQAQSIVGSILSDMGRNEEAEQLLRGILAMKRKVFGDSHSQVLTTANALLLNLTAQRKLDDAVKIGREIVETAQRTLGADHSHTLTYMSNLAAALTQQRNFAEAEKTYRAILAVRETSTGPTARPTLATKNALGNLLCDTGRVEEGYTLLNEVRESLDATMPPDHWLLGLSRSHVGQALLDLKRYDESKAMLEDGYRRLEAALGADHHNTRVCAKSLADLAKATGDAAAQEKWTLLAEPPKPAEPASPPGDGKK